MFLQPTDHLFIYFIFFFSMSAETKTFFLRLTFIAGFFFAGIACVFPVSHKILK